MNTQLNASLHCEHARKKNPIQ